MLKVGFLLSYPIVTLLLKELYNVKTDFRENYLIPSTNARFGVISDIDDTIIHTGVVSILKWKVIYNTIFKHAARRIPLEGAAEFYHKLHRGVSEKMQILFFM